MPETQESPKAARLPSLDVFRGLTIAGMLLVNNPGSWSHILWKVGDTPEAPLVAPPTADARS